MHIQAGALKGRRIDFTFRKEPSPTAGMVRMALFNVLGPRIRGAVFLDLFAGSGAVGFEAASRGAAEVHFIEQDPGLAESARKNLDRWTLTGRVWEGPAIFQIDRMEREKAAFDVIYIDPPYYGTLATDALFEVARRGILKSDGLAVVERHHKDPAPTPETLDAASLVRSDSRTYGATALDFYRFAAPRS